MKTKFTRRVCTVQLPAGGTKDIEFNSREHKLADLTDANMERMAIEKHGEGTRLLAVRDFCTMEETPDQSSQTPEHPAGRVIDVNAGDNIKARST